MSCIFVTPRDMSYDFFFCLLFSSSPFPRPSAFPHHVPFCLPLLCLCFPCLPVPLFVFPFLPIALLPSLAAPFILCALVTCLHFRCNRSYHSSAFLRYTL